MKTSKEAAIRIAQDFVTKDQCPSTGPFQFASFHSVKEEQGFAQKLGVNNSDSRDEWWVSFELIENDPNVLYSSPDEIIVIVDDETGEPRFRSMI